ncbi:MAG: hypothetical protein ACREJ3_10140 [Polyangiaceae bacterium]
MIHRHVRHVRHVRHLRRVLAAGAVLALLVGEQRAWAQSSPNAIPVNNGDGMDTHLFRPAMDSKGLFTVNGSDVLGDREVSFGIVSDYGHVLLRQPGDNQLIDHSFQGTLQFNYGIANRVVVGVDMPIDLMSGSQQATPRERHVSGPSG